MLYAWQIEKYLVLRECSFQIDPKLSWRTRFNRSLDRRFPPRNELWQITQNRIFGEQLPFMPHFKAKQQVSGSVLLYQFAEINREHSRYLTIADTVWLHSICERLAPAQVKNRQAQFKLELLDQIAGYNDLRPGDRILVVIPFSGSYLTIEFCHDQHWREKAPGVVLQCLPAPSKIDAAPRRDRPAIVQLPKERTAAAPHRGPPMFHSRPNGVSLVNLGQIA